MNDLIEMDAHTRFGKPCVRGTRISVGDVLEALAAGLSVEELLTDFPQLTRASVLACIDFAARRERSTALLSVA